jgi:hypothetical protein
VLAKGRRALLCYGAAHLVRRGPGLRVPPSLASIIEQRSGEQMYTIGDLVPSAADPGGLAGQLSRYPPGAVIPAAGTWLGAVDAGLLFHVIAFGPDRAPVNPFRGVPLGSLLDAGLYLGQPGDLTGSRPNPAIYLDPAYWEELQRRSALPGGRAVNLDSYRREQPAQYPLPQLPPSPQSGTANPAGEQTPTPARAPDIQICTRPLPPALGPHPLLVFLQGGPVAGLAYADDGNLTGQGQAWHDALTTAGVDN